MCACVCVRLEEVMWACVCDSVYKRYVVYDLGLNFFFLHWVGLILEMKIIRK